MVPVEEQLRQRRLRWFGHVWRMHTSHPQRQVEVQAQRKSVCVFAYIVHITLHCIPYYDKYYDHYLNIPPLCHGYNHTTFAATYIYHLRRLACLSVCHCILNCICLEMQKYNVARKYSGTSLIRSLKFRAPRSTGQVL